MIEGGSPKFFWPCVVFFFGGGAGGAAVCRLQMTFGRSLKKIFGQGDEISDKAMKSFDTRQILPPSSSGMQNVQNRVTFTRCSPPGCSRPPRKNLLRASCKTCANKNTDARLPCWQFVGVTKSLHCTIMQLVKNALTWWNSRTIPDKQELSIDVELSVFQSSHRSKTFNCTMAQNYKIIFCFKGSKAAWIRPCAPGVGNFCSLRSKSSASLGSRPQHFFAVCVVRSAAHEKENLTARNFLSLLRDWVLPLGRLCLVAEKWSAQGHWRKSLFVTMSKNIACPQLFCPALLEFHLVDFLCNIVSTCFPGSFSTCFCAWSFSLFQLTLHSRHVQ